ncbi:MAG: hypothetical protein ACETWM_12415 [Candidatus Lokiarchaeia archaeon]
MGKEYKIAFYGTIITMISFILIGILVLGMGPAMRDFDLLGIAWLSIAQVELPLIGTLPALTFNQTVLMALADISMSNTSLLLGLGVLGSLPFAIGGVMTGYGFYGLYKQEDSTLCLITSIILMIGFGALAVIIPLGLLPTTIISPWTFLIYYGFTQILPLTQTVTIGGGFGIALALTGLILAVSYIILGVTLIVVREKTPKRDLMLAAGILSILGALLFIGIIGIALIFVVYILLALVFNELRK